MTLVVDGTVGRGGFSVRVSFSAAPRRAVALVGGNGTGKSTALRTIAGLLPLVSGTIVRDGIVLDDAVRSIFVPAERRRAGVVFQGLHLFPHLDVRRNIEWAVREGGADRARARAVATHWLERTGCAHLADRDVSRLSGGEAQRVALARALAPSPAMLLLDEPFAAVDAASRPGLRALVGGTVADFEGPVIVVSHDAADVEALASEVVELPRTAVEPSGSADR